MSTGIQWTDETINPIAAFDRATGKRGWFCVHASTGCLNCYAEQTNGWRGNGHKYRAPNASKVEIRIVDHVLAQPLRWITPKRVFVCSMTDLFLDEHTDEMIDRVFAMMASAPRHTFQVLTKRAERMNEYISTPGRAGAIAAEMGGGTMFPFVRPDDLAARWPLANVWHGVSAENQEQFDERVSWLISIPGITTPWVSYEPALGPLNCRSLVDLNCAGATLAWIVIGGESGTKARQFEITWARDVIRQCRRFGITRPFVKQLGRFPVERTDGFVTWPDVELRDRHGGEMEEWPEDLRVREFPTIAEAASV